jgi:hypothetical protein
VPRPAFGEPTQLVHGERGRPYWYTESAAGHFGPFEPVSWMAGRRQRRRTIGFGRGFATNCGESSYPKESINADNITVKLKPKA